VLKNGIYNAPPSTRQDVNHFTQTAGSVEEKKPENEVDSERRKRVYATSRQALKRGATAL
jgi:hypothetical protein